MENKHESSKPRFNILDIGDIMMEGKIKSDFLCPECKDTLCKGEIESEDKPQFTEEQFDKMMIDNNIVEYMTPAHYLLFTNKAKENGYIISVKPGEPLIIHNVMLYKGKNYLRQHTQINPNCNKCSLKSNSNVPFNICRGKFKCDPFSYWKSFDDIEITDELACMRKDIGDIYITGINSFGDTFPLYYVLKNNTIDYTQDEYMEISIEKFRLSTAEELQEYFNR